MGLESIKYLTWWVQWQNNNVECNSYSYSSTSVDLDEIIDLIPRINRILDQHALKINCLWATRTKIYKIDNLWA